MAVPSNVEWLNQNALRAYPVAEDAPRSDLQGLITVPDYMLVDVVLTVPTQLADLVHVSAIQYTGKFLTLILGRDGQPLATVTVNADTHTPNTPYRVAPYPGDFDDLTGWVVIGDIGRLADDMPFGVYEFGSAAMPLEPCTVRPDLRGVKSLSVDNQGDISAKLYDDVELVAGSNIRLDVDTNASRIVVNAVAVSSELVYDECEDVEEVTPISTINGINAQNVAIASGDSCTTVDSSGGVVRIGNKCTEPCCGCVEADFLADKIRMAEATLSTLSSLHTSLAARMEQFRTAVLGSL